MPAAGIEVAAAAIPAAAHRATHRCAPSHNQHAPRGPAHARSADEGGASVSCAQCILWAAGRPGAVQGAATQFGSRRRTAVGSTLSSRAARSQRQQRVPSAVQPHELRHAKHARGWQGRQLAGSRCAEASPRHVVVTLRQLLLAPKRRGKRGAATQFVGLRRRPARHKPDWVGGGRHETGGGGPCRFGAVPTHAAPPLATATVGGCVGKRRLLGSLDEVIGDGIPPAGASRLAVKRDGPSGAM